MIKKFLILILLFISSISFALTPKTQFKSKYIAKRIFDVNKINYQYRADMLELIIELFDASSMFFRTKRYLTKSMYDDCFEIDLDLNVEYLRQDEMQKLKISTKDGVLIRTININAGENLYVMDSKGNVLLANDADFAGFKKMEFHSVLAGGHGVSAAGEIIIKDGKLNRIDAQSGHYRPSYFFFAQGIHNILMQGFFARDLELSVEYIQKKFVFSFENNNLIIRRVGEEIVFPTNIFLNKQISAAS